MKTKKIYPLFLITLLSSIICISGCDNSQEEPANATAETTPEASETTTSLTEGVAFIMDDGTSIYIDDLLRPIQLYDNICATGKSDGFTDIYPEAVVNYLIATYNVESVDDYALLLYDVYHQIYNNDCSMVNEYISCELLSSSELEDFADFYLENMNSAIVPEYGFIVESEYIITYIDDSGEEQSDKETDYYIAYYLDGKVYLDYYFIDTLDL